MRFAATSRDFHGRRSDRAFLLREIVLLNALNESLLDSWLKKALGTVEARPAIQRDRIEAMRSLARISIVETKAVTGGAAAAALHDELMPLLVAVYRKLTPAQKSAFRKPT